VLALEQLRSDVIADFAANALDVEQPFGERMKSRQLGDRPRIVWVPGDERGDAGPILAARNPGRNPRPVLTLEELFHVEITGWDLTAPDDERYEFAQWHATRLLLDEWLRAVFLAAEGTFRIVSTRWPVGNVEARFGLSCVVTGAIQSMIPDETYPELPANTAIAVLDPLDLASTADAPQTTDPQHPEPEPDETLDDP
jgi:hypothetical protein